MIKKRKILSLILVLSMVLTGFTVPANAAVKSTSKAKQKQTALSKRQVMSIVEEVMETDDYVEGQVMVVLKPEFSSKQAKFSTVDFPEVSATKVENLTYCENPGSDLISDDFRTILLVTLKHKTDEELVQTVDSLMDREDVESVSLNEKALAAGTQTVPPSDTQFSYQWALEKIDAMGAWSKTTGSAEVKVGIIDTGIDYTHDELAKNMWKNPGEIPGDGIDNDNNGYVDDVYGWDFINNNSDPKGSHYHGTFCAGIIAADLNNKDVVGIAPNVKLVALEAADSSNFFPYSASVKAITYASNMGIDILNYSASGTSRNTAFDNAIRNYNGIFVAAAGNDSNNNDVTPMYPKTTDFTNLIKVANTTASDVLRASSNYGVADVTLAAPGTSVLSTTLNNTYASSSGTSFSAPYVVGVAALIKSQYPSLSTTDIINSIKEGVDKLDSLAGKVTTGGRLNANKALELARFKSLGWQVRYCMDVYNYADFKEAMENDFYSAVRIFNDIELQGEVKLTRSKQLFGGVTLKGKGKRHFIIDTTSSVNLDLGGIVYENGGIENKSSNFSLEGSGAVIKSGNWTYGGAINNSGTMTVTGIRIENNSATFGGGIYNTGTMTLTDTTVYNNQATDGGALYTTGSVTLSGGNLKSNSAYGNGGAVNGGSDSQIIVKNTPVIIDNMAVYSGGGIFTSGILKTLSPDGLKVRSNIAKNGGGLYGATGADIHLEGKSPGGPSITIDNNQSSENGGGVYLDTGANLYLSTTFLAVNKAQGTGGAMLVKGTYTPGSFVQLIGNTPNSIVYQ